MLVEAAVFGRERRLDQRVGEIRQWDGIVVLDAAAADLVAVAVEEHGEPLPDLARPAPGLEEEIVEAGVGIQQEALQLWLPLLLLGIGIELAQHRLIFEKPTTLMAS